MAHVIIRGANGRRHEVDFEDADITVELHASEDHVELVIDLPPKIRAIQKESLFS